MFILTSSVFSIMKSLFLSCIAAHLAQCTLALGQTAPAGCLKLSTDSDWPAPEIWKAALPGVVRESKAGKVSPDYRIQAKNTADVQKAVKFAAQHGIRLSVITTGHDQLGRSDAASGLLIDVSALTGINALESFTPSLAGAKSPKPNEKANVIVPQDGVQAAVTFGPGVATQALNNALSPSKLFT